MERKKRIIKKRGNKKSFVKKLNLGSILFLVGLILFIISLLLRQIMGGISFIINFNLASLLLAYVGLTTHFILIKDQPFSKSWNYIKESGNFVYSVIGVFFAFALIGFFVPASENLTKIILEFIEKLLEQTKDMSAGELTRFIFLNNLQASFFGLIFGVVLGIFPVLAAVANGYILGFVGAMSVEAEGIFVLWRIFPHGIFELPAIFISLGLGFKLGSFIFRKEKGKFFRRCFWNSLRVFLFVVMPLLIIAAIIEGCLIFFG